MSLTDEPRDIPEAGPPPERPDDHARSTVPTIATLRWPIVQALRGVGRASDAELVELVADSLRLTDQQRAEMIPSGQETRLKNRVSWAAHELKQIGAVYYPEPSVRALTALGNEIGDDQIKSLHRAFEAEERQRRKAKKKVEQVLAHTPAMWLIRAGGQGELAKSFVENGIAAVGFGQLGDLSEVSSRDEILELVKLDRPESSDGQARASANQLWAFLSQVRRGDMVVMPSMNNSGFALGTVTEEYWYRHDAADAMHHAVSVDWKPDEIPRTAVRQDLLKALGLRPTINLIRSDDHARRVQQLLETGQDPGPQSALDLPNLVEQFYNETGYPTDHHEEQKRLREAWAEKFAPDTIECLTHEDLAAYTSSSVDHAKGEYVKPAVSVPKWIEDADDDGPQWDKLLDSIHDLCSGTEELPARIDRLVDETGASRKDTGTKGFAQSCVNATLAICHPEKFLPIGVHGGKWGFRDMLRRLGLPEPHGSTYGQQAVDANDRLREHLIPHLGDDPQAIACFLYWLTSHETGRDGDEADDETTDLSVLVQRFRAESRYPTEAHEEQERLRAEWAEKLAPENIAHFSRRDLTGVASHGTRNRARYVYPYARGVMQWISRLDEDEYSRLLDSIEYLCWGEDEAWVRYDQLTDHRSARSVRGLGDSTATRLLAIAHPKDFLPIGPRPGLWSRYTLLRRLGLQEPQGSSHGQRVIEGNNRLLKFLAPHFGDDTLEMGAFLEWLIKQRQPPPKPPVHADLGELAAELLIDEVGFLEDIVELLQDKGQVILYGPPGTGKTYLARALANVLAPDDSCRALVQFHPSTSYEDFFEGYRPAGTGDEGNVRYELTPGPLARMAEQASEARNKQHVMIIDEINRANLPRVLGELLFLLEYRDESARTLYRPDEPFKLPKNLWFIGTMNTADRSIALVDAALRRRFHFVPFSPDRGPMAGLLARWLESKDEPAWVARLVDAVNNELMEALGGSDLLLGPSHFMKEYGSSLETQRERLRRIWEYNIEPFIEDQFFGDPVQIKRFQFDAVIRRNGPSGEREAGTSRDPRDSEQGPASAGSGGDGEIWTRRASEFPRQDRAGDERHHAEIRQVVRRYVEYALNRGADPGSRDDQLVEEFLSSQEPAYADKTKSDYRRHINEWFDHAGAKWGT